MNEIEKLPDLGFSDIFEYSEKLTPEKLEAIQYLAHGLSIVLVAKRVNLTPHAIQTWVRDDPEFLLALQQAKARIGQWHSQMLTSARYLAEEQIVTVLSLDYDKAPRDVKAEIARMARFVVEMDNTAKDGGITNNNLFAPQMFISDQSADIIARRVRELDVEGVVNPVLETDFNPKKTARQFMTHPETDFGVMNYDEDDDLYQCHVCGKWFKELYDHAATMHGLKKAEYVEAFRLTP